MTSISTASELEALPENSMVLDRQDGASPLNMSRCSGSDECMNTTPLPPRSSWLCADHQQHLTIRGGSR